MDAHTYTTKQLAPLIGVNLWTIYATVRADEPISINGLEIRPIKVGRAIRWPRGPIDKALGIDSDTEAISA